MDNKSKTLEEFTYADYIYYNNKIGMLPYYKYQKYVENKKKINCKKCGQQSPYLNITYMCEKCSFNTFKEKHWTTITKLL